MIHLRYEYDFSYEQFIIFLIQDLRVVTQNQLWWNLKEMKASLVMRTRYTQQAVQPIKVEI